MDNKKTPNFFSPSLFWDVDINTLDIDTHARFITERVICRGSINDWKMLLSLYGVEKIRLEALSIRSLDPKSLSFLSVYFNTPETDFRCCN